VVFDKSKIVSYFNYNAFIKSVDDIIAIRYLFNTLIEWSIFKKAMTFQNPCLLSDYQQSITDRPFTRLEYAVNKMEKLLVIEDFGTQNKNSFVFSNLRHAIPETLYEIKQSLEKLPIDTDIPTIHHRLKQLYFMNMSSRYAPSILELVKLFEDTNEDQPQIGGR
jgi:hypothetical protein